MLLGLRSAFCYVDDIAAAKSWYSKVLGFQPYFEQPFYVGFNVGGYELGLSPGNTPRAYGAYWGVKDVKAVYARLLELGAAPRGEIQDVGEGIPHRRRARSLGQCVRHHPEPQFQTDMTTSPVMKRAPS